MKKTALFILFLGMLISCHKKEGSQGTKDILIKGSLSGSTKGSGSKGITGNTLSLTDAARVLVIFGDQSFISEIKNGSFSVNVPMGSATALIFVDANNTYIGNLSVSGLNILPLVNLSDGENTVIDLSTLSLEGTSIIPSDNPIGSKIMISDKDIAILKEIGSFYEAIAKNIDTDNDGIPDNFDNKEIIVNSQFMFEGGRWGLNGSPASVLDSSQLQIMYGIRIKGWKALWSETRNISFSGPAGAPYNDIMPRGEDFNDNCGCFDTFWARMVQNPGQGSPQPPFAKGIYTFTVDGINNHTINYSSISAKYFLLLAVPEIKTNSKGEITQVLIDYMLPDKTPAQTSKYITTVAIQFHSEATMLHQEGSIFNVREPLPDFNSVNITKPVNLGQVTGMDIMYTDLVGNMYSITWRP